MRWWSEGMALPQRVLGAELPLMMSLLTTPQMLAPWKVMTTEGKLEPGASAQTS